MPKRTVETWKTLHVNVIDILLACERNFRAHNISTNRFLNKTTDKVVHGRGASLPLMLLVDVLVDWMVLTKVVVNSCVRLAAYCLLACSAVPIHRVSSNVLLYFQLNNTLNLLVASIKLGLPVDLDTISTKLLNGLDATNVRVELQKESVPMCLMLLDNELDFS